jgi:hypothetical protein
MFHSAVSVNAPVLLLTLEEEDRRYLRGPIVYEVDRLVFYVHKLQEDTDTICGYNAIGFPMLLTVRGNVVLCPKVQGFYAAVTDEVDEDNYGKYFYWMIEVAPIGSPMSSFDVSNGIRNEKLMADWSKMGFSGLSPNKVIILRNPS